MQNRCALSSFVRSSCEYEFHNSQPKRAFGITTDVYNVLRDSWDIDDGWIPELQMFRYVPRSLLHALWILSLDETLSASSSSTRKYIVQVRCLRFFNKWCAVYTYLKQLVEKVLVPHVVESLAAVETTHIDIGSIFSRAKWRHSRTLNDVIIQPSPFWNPPCWVLIIWRMSDSHHDLLSTTASNSFSIHEGRVIADSLLDRLDACCRLYAML